MRHFTVLLSLVAMCACGETVDYALVFPSAETFLISKNATVDVFDGSGVDTESPDAICRSLSVGNDSPLNSLAGTSKKDVCEFRAGLTIDSVPPGRLVFFAEAEDNDGTTLLRGCTVVDVTNSLPSSCVVDTDCPPGYGCRTRRDSDGESRDLCVLEVQLATLPSYPDAVDISQCPNQETKCNAGCP